MSETIESPALLVESNGALGKALAQHIEISDAVRKATERVAFAAYPVGIDDTLRKTMESVRIDDDALRRTVGSASAAYAEQFARPVGIDNDALRKAVEGVRGIDDAVRKTMESVRIDNDALKRSFDHSALLSRNIAETLSTMHISAPATGSFRDAFELPRVELRADPAVLQTNSQLSELTDRVAELVDVARQQAELSQSINKSVELAAIQSGENDRKNIRLIWATILITVIVAIFNAVSNYTQSRSTEASVNEGIRLLQRLNDRPQPRAEQNKGTQPASAR